jgi:hypothetical protein
MGAGRREQKTPRLEETVHGSGKSRPEMNTRRFPANAFGTLM